MDGDDVYWLESRPAEGGRQDAAAARPRRRDPRAHARAVQRPQPRPRVRRRVVRRRAAGSSSPRRWRTAGCGAWTRRAPRDPSPSRPRARGGTATCGWTRPGRACTPSARPIPTSPRRIDLVRNELVAIALDGSDGEGRVLVTGPDFVAGARPSPDGATLAWVEWDHPAMPWDATRLRVAAIREDGSLGEARTIAGGTDISVVQPAWSPAGRAPRRLGPGDGLVEPVRVRRPGRDRRAGAEPRADGRGARRARLGAGRRRRTRSSPTARSSPSARADGRETLAPDRARRRRVRRLETPFSDVSGLTAAGDGAIAVVGEPARAAVARPPHGRGRGRGRAGPLAVGPARTRATCPSRSRSPSPRRAAPRPAPCTSRRRTRASAAPDGEQPPLIVLSHGGPTGVGEPPRCRWTARSSRRAGIAVVDVDYRGSTGYGRPYRDALKGQWGVVDVDDCVAAARFLVGPRRRGPGAPRDPGRQLRRLHDARGARVPARRVRRRHQPLRDRRPRADPPGRPQVRVALRRDAWSPRGPRPAARSCATARRSTTSAGCGRRCCCSRASTTGSCRRPSST